MKINLSIITLISVTAVFPLALVAQSNGNPWNPYATAPVQRAPAPLYFQDSPQPRPPAQPQQPSRYAPPGLDQQLSTGPQYFPQFQNFAPQPYGYFPQGYGGGPQNYPAPNPNSGGFNPFSSFGFPGGFGGMPSFPGGQSNGGFPGINFSPFGFF